MNKPTRKVGWGLIGNGYWHLVVRGEEPRSPERTACGVETPPSVEPQPDGGCCSKCRAYAAKRRWLP